jgi:ABC-type arginine transport system permease subunit
MKQTTPKFLIMMIVFFGVQVLISASLVVFSPHIFIRALNIFIISVLSGVIGAFIREIFIIKQKDASNNADAT